MTALRPVTCDLSRAAAANMRRIREGLGWSRDRLAAEAGLSSGMVVFLETGRRDFTLPTLERVAKALGVPGGELLADPPQRPQESR